jgi:hypothetical protein
MASEAHRLMRTTPRDLRDARQHMLNKSHEPDLRERVANANEQQG